MITIEWSPLGSMVHQRGWHHASKMDAVDAIQVLREDWINACAFMDSSLLFCKWESLKLLGANYTQLCIHAFHVPK